MIDFQGTNYLLNMIDNFESPLDKCTNSKIESIYDFYYRNFINNIDNEYNCLIFFITEDIIPENEDRDISYLKKGIEYINKNRTKLLWNVYIILK